MKFDRLLGSLRVGILKPTGDIPAFISVLINGEFQPEADSDQSGVVDFANIPASSQILVGS